LELLELLAARAGLALLAARAGLDISLFLNSMREVKNA
jgi:hypothetical protein